MNKIISIDDKNKPGNAHYFISNIELSVKDMNKWFDLFDNDENINKVKEYNYIFLY